MYSADNEGKRLDVVRLKFNKNKKEWCKILSFASVTTYDSIVRGEKNVSKRVALNLKKEYNQLNLNWFFMGQGEMFLNSEKKSKSPEVPEIQSSKEESELLALYRKYTALLEKYSQLLEASQEEEVEGNEFVDSENKAHKAERMYNEIKRKEKELNIPSID